MENTLNFLLRNIIYNYPNIFVVSWWGTYSYFNHEQIQIGHIEIMTAVYGSSESFGSIVRSKSIGHNMYTGRIINFR